MRINNPIHQQRIAYLAGLLSLAAQANSKAKYCQHQHDTHSFLSSPFVSKTKWDEDAKKWNYISYRLEKCYFKKLCELNSLAYREMTD